MSVVMQEGAFTTFKFQKKWNQTDCIKNCNLVHVDLYCRNWYKIQYCILQIELKDATSTD